MRTLQDLKLEKARLKYEMLVAENNLAEDLHAVERVFNFSTTIANFSKGISVARKAYEKLSSLFGKFSGKKKKKKSKEDASEVDNDA